MGDGDARVRSRPEARRSLRARPGTARPCLRRCSASSAPRPKTNGSPPLRRTTRLAESGMLDEHVVDLGLRHRAMADRLACRDPQGGSWERGRAVESWPGGRKRSPRPSSLGSPGPGGSKARGRPARPPRGKRSRPSRLIRLLLQAIDLKRIELKTLPPRRQEGEMRRQRRDQRSRFHRGFSPV